MVGASATVEVVDEVYEIPANDWRYIDLGLKQRPGRVSAHYQSQPEGSRVRLALMHREELERLRAGAHHSELAETKPTASGILSHDVLHSGDYVIVVENQSNTPASVHLRVRLQFSNVTTLSPQRQLTVIAVSLLCFFGVVTFSARRLLRAVRKPAGVTSEPGNSA